MAVAGGGEWETISARIGGRWWSSDLQPFPRSG